MYIKRIEVTEIFIIFQIYLLGFCVVYRTQRKYTCCITTDVHWYFQNKLWINGMHIFNILCVFFFWKVWVKCSCVPPCGVRQQWRRHQRAGSQGAFGKQGRRAHYKKRVNRRSVKTFQPQPREEERGRQRQGERQAERHTHTGKTAKRSGWRLKNAEIFLNYKDSKSALY